MLYRLNDEFTKIEQTEGLMQNMTQNSQIEVVACADNPQKDSGIILLPMEKLRFTAKEGEHVFARCAKIDGTIANLSVVNFKKPASGSTGAGCNCNLIDDTVTMSDKTWSSKKINDTFTKYYSKTEIDNMISTGTGGSPGNYSQVTKIGVVAPKTYDLPIKTTNTFNLPPAEVLKFKAGSEGQIKTICDFNNTDAEDFIIDDVSGEKAKCVEYDGVMKPRTWQEINVSASVSLEDMFICESDNINIDDYKKINAMEIGGLNGEIVPAPGTFTDYVLATAASKSSGATKKANNHWVLNYDYAAFKLGSLGTNRCVVQFKFAEGTDLGTTGWINFSRAGSSTRPHMGIHIINLKIGSMYTCIYDPANKHVEVLENGLRLKNNLDYKVFCITYSASGNLQNNWYFVIEGTGTFIFDSFSYVLNVPDDTTIKYKYNLYQKDNDVYGIVNNTFLKIANNYSTLSDIDKKTLFESTDGKIPTIADLVALGNFKMLYLSTAANNHTNLWLEVVPKDQLVLPKDLISTESFESIDKAKLTTKTSKNVKCKLLVTNDLKTYQTYDFKTQSWQIVDYANMPDVAAKGIDSLQLQDIPRDAWKEIMSGKSGIGFAYMLSIEDITDICEVDKLELQVDMKGSWKKALHGTDYDYEYPANNELSVTLMTNGDYKINYCKG